MKGSNSLMDWLVKLIFFLMLLPFFVSLALHVLSTTFQIILALFLAILPWLIAFATLIGLVAGVSAGLVLRRRLPRRYREYPPPGVPSVRRPREVRGRDEDE